MKTQNPQLSDVFKTPQRKTYTTIAVTVALIGVMIAFGLRPAFMQIRALNKEIHDKQEFLDRIDGKLTALNYLIKRKDEVQDKLPAFDEDFPYEKNSGFLVANFDGIASKFDLILSRVDFDEEIYEEEINLDEDNLDPENVYAIETTITVLGDFRQIEQYVEYLEKFPRIFDVQGVSLTPVDENDYYSESSSSHVVSMRGEIVMYVYHWDGEMMSEESTVSEEN